MFAPTLTLPYLTTPSFSRSLSHSLLAQVGRGTHTHTHPQRGVHLVHLPIRLKIQKKSIACSNCLKKTENSCLGAACCNQPMKKKKNKKKKQNILTNRRFCVCVQKKIINGRNEEHKKIFCTRSRPHILCISLIRTIFMLNFCICICYCDSCILFVFLYIHTYISISIYIHLLVLPHIYYICHTYYMYDPQTHIRVSTRG